MRGRVKNLKKKKKSLAVVPVAWSACHSGAGGS